VAGGGRNGEVLMGGARRRFGGGTVGSYGEACTEGGWKLGVSASRGATRGV